MPELPEVECVRRTLADRVVGRRVEGVDVHRAGVIRGQDDADALLRGRVIERIDRHGKQLAIVAGPTHPGGPRPCVVVHLGMSGQLRLAIGDNKQPTSSIKRPARAESSPDTAVPAPTHCHVAWRLDQGEMIRFIDPRRFGGLWTFPDTAERDEQRWAILGPDALRATPARLARALRATHRAIKAALLDQQVVAGLGNIYVDELLFGCRINPLTPANTLEARQAARLCRSMRSLLARAIAGGGSTLRDYVDASGAAGGYQLRHRVYGRAGQRCQRRSCGALLVTGQVAGRTTVWCPVCQPGGLSHNPTRNHCEDGQTDGGLSIDGSIRSKKEK